MLVRRAMRPEKSGWLDEVLAAGATRVVVVRAITEADDPAAATASFTRRLRVV